MATLLTERAELRAEIERLREEVERLRNRRCELTHITVTGHTNYRVDL